VPVWYERPLCCVPVVEGVVRTPVVLIVRSEEIDTRWAWFQIDARYASRGFVLDVVPDRVPLCRRDTRGAWFQIAACCAGVVPGRCGRRMLVATQKADRAAEHGIAADRFAREIVGFLTVFLGRARGS